MIVGIIQHKHTTDLERCFQLQQDGLAEENFPRFETEATDFALCQLYVLSWPGAFNWKTNTRDQLRIVGNKPKQTKKQMCQIRPSYQKISPLKTS